MDPNQDQLAEMLEQGKNVYIKKNKWYHKHKLGLELRRYENGNRNDGISSVRRCISDHS